MTYVKAFTAELNYYKKNGMSDEQIEQMYELFLEERRSDDRFRAHVRSMEGANLDTGTIMVQRGSQRRDSAKAEADPMNWSSIIPTVFVMVEEDHHEQYSDFLPIRDLLEKKELTDVLDEFNARKTTITEYLVRDYSQTEISDLLGVSNAAVSKQVAAIRAAVEPFAIKYHYITG